MKIELRNIKRAAFASEETHCFEATIYIDGKRAGDVRNDGHGGPNFYQPFALETRLAEYAATLPPVAMDMGDGTTETYPQDADILIGDLLEDHLLAKDLKRAMTNKILFTKVGSEGIFETRKLTPAQVGTYLRDPQTPAKLKAVQILNLLPMETALAIYKGGK
jgi:hypothetical protein